MNSHRRVKTAAIPPVPHDVQVFVLSEILPDHCCLVLDLFHRSVTVLRFEEAVLASSHACFSLTPSAARVLACMLRASPASCSYQALFAALYPLGSDAGGWEPTLGLRPIRRALRALAPVLRQLGLQVVALRGQGYLLVGAPRPEETGREPAIPSRRSTEQKGRSAC